MKRCALAAATVCIIAAALEIAGLHASGPGSNLDGWKPLFNGRDLAGWRALKSETPGDGWLASHGVLTRARNGGDLVTVDQFADFELNLEWKISKGGNSGILYRVNLDNGEAYETGPEFQILDNLDAADRLQPNHRAGSLYDLVAPARDTTRPLGRWNRTRIVIRGWKIEHWLNGKKIVDVDLASPEGKALIARSKFAGSAHFASFGRGHIVLQDHGDVVSFRRIRIRDLGGP